MKKYMAVLMFVFTGILVVSCAKDGEPGAPGPAGYVMTAFQDGVSPSNAYDMTNDCFATSTLPNGNFGSQLYLSCGDTYVSMVKWDISSLVPSDISVKKAYVTFYNYMSFDSALLSVHAVQNEWDETQMTWVSRTAGAMWDTPGGDYGPSLNTFTVDAAIDSYTVELPAATVQAWLSDPDSNYGIAIKKVSGTAASFLISSQNDTVALKRPKLTLYYALP